MQRLIPKPVALARFRHKQFDVRVGGEARISALWSLSWSKVKRTCGKKGLAERDATRGVFTQVPFQFVAI
jgi:hypothetical protein